MMIDKTGVKRLGVSAGGVIDPVTKTITSAKIMGRIGPDHLGQRCYTIMMAHLHWIQLSMPVVRLTAPQWTARPECPGFPAFFGSSDLSKKIDAVDAGDSSALHNH